MSIVVLAMGSRGDVDPMVALATGLRAAGHEVTIVVPRDLRASADVAGLRVATFAVDMHEATRGGSGLAWQRDAGRGLATEARLMRAVMRDAAPTIAQGVVDHVREADLVISGVLTYEAARAAQRQFGFIHVLALLAPVAPARDGASTLFAPRPSRTSWVNGVASLGVALAAYGQVKPIGRMARLMLGHRSRGLADFGRFVADAVHTPALLACSAQLVPADPAWRGHVHLTGPWRSAEPAPELPDEVEDFLAAGPPPAYVGFGSMAALDADEAAQLAIAATERSGHRLVLGGVPSAAQLKELPRRAIAVADVPHERLFPRMAVTAHHGGAGTTHSASRAGVPQVVVPHLGDQFYWGRRAHQLGVAVAPIPRAEVSAECLGRALWEADHPVMHERATQLAERMNGEDGVAAAIAVIHSRMKH